MAAAGLTLTSGANPQVEAVSEATLALGGAANPQVPEQAPAALLTVGGSPLLRPVETPAAFLVIGGNAPVLGLISAAILVVSATAATQFVLVPAALLTVVGAVTDSVPSGYGAQLGVADTVSGPFFFLTDSAQVSITGYARAFPVVPITGTAVLTVASTDDYRSVVGGSAASLTVLAGAPQFQSTTLGATLAVVSPPLVGTLPNTGAAILAIGAAVVGQVPAAVLGSSLIITALAKAGAGGVSQAVLSVSSAGTLSLIYTQTALVIIYEVVGGVPFTQPGTIVGAVLTVGSSSAAATNESVPRFWRRMVSSSRRMDDFSVTRTMVPVVAS